MSNKDLLTQTLRFNVIPPQSKAINIFQIVIDGRLTQLHKMLSEFETVVQIVNSKDPEGKTPLFYACYFNFQNIVMYLLMRGADPFIISQSGFNIFHVCAYRGNLECLHIIYNMLKHKLDKQSIETLKQLMKQYRFKKTDVHHGVLVCSDKHLKQAQQRFEQFQSEVKGLYKSYLEKLKLYLDKAISIPDEFQKNPIHYASLSKYTKCLQCTKFLTLYSLNLQGWDFFYDMFMEVQLLEQSSDKKEDPRQYHHFNDLTQNFLDAYQVERGVYVFMRDIKSMQKQVVNTQDNDGYTPMHIASFSGDFAAIQFILSIGGDPKLKCRKKQLDVLDYASNDQVRKYLMDLKNAAKDGDQKSFELLVNCGQLVNGKATIYGIAPVHNAVANTHTSHSNNMLNQVLEMEADVNVTDTNGWTPLHHAAQYGELEAITSLIKRGASVHIFSNKGYFPIHVAALNNQSKAIKLLVEYGANPNCQDDQQCTPLHLAAKKGYPEVIQTLFDLKADIYMVDNRLWSALHYASFYMHKEVVHKLCRFDANFDKLRYMRTTKGQLAKDMMTNSEVKFAFETLWNAAQNGDLDTVRKLVTLKHNIDEQTYEFNFTPLILASKNNHFLIVKYLLSQGADRGLTDKYGYSALDYAVKQKNPKISQLLKVE